VIAQTLSKPEDLSTSDKMQGLIKNLEAIGWDAFRYGQAWLQSWLPVSSYTVW